MYDPKYKLKHKVTPIARLGKYVQPLPMVDDPPFTDWGDRCRAVYEWMMALKGGVVPPPLRKGLWFYAE